MNSKYIVRQPIKDAQSRIVGYEILYYGENQAFGGDGSTSSNDFAAADTVYNFLTQNTARGLRGSLNFMTFTTTLLMKKTPRLFPKDELVIQIDDSVIIHPLSMHFVQQYAVEGYKIAVNEFQFSARYLALLDCISYIKINFKDTSDSTLRNIIEVARSMNKICIATEIDSAEMYQKALECGVDQLEGPYVAEKLATKAHTSGYLQSNFFRLMVAVTRDDADLEEVEQIISMDATLTYGLLKMANSVYFALRNRATSVHQAVMTLGLSQLRQWVYLLSASNAENSIDPASEEFLKLSFMRASFCRELVSYTGKPPLSKSDAYLMGMLSTLNYLIDAPMEEILSEIPVSDAIRSALLYGSGPAGVIYALVLDYERADWPAINALTEKAQFPTNLLTSVYFNCLENVNAVWEQMDKLMPQEESAETPPQA